MSETIYGGGGFKSIPPLEGDIEVKNVYIVMVEGKPKLRVEYDLPEE